MRLTPTPVIAVTTVINIKGEGGEVNLLRWGNWSLPTVPQGPPLTSHPPQNWDLSPPIPVSMRFSSTKLPHLLNFQELVHYEEITTTQIIAQKLRLSFPLNPHHYPTLNQVSNMHVAGVLNLPLFPKVTQSICAWYRVHVSKVPEKMSVKNSHDDDIDERDAPILS